VSYKCAVREEGHLSKRDSLDFAASGAQTINSMPDAERHRMRKPSANKQSDGNE
jgi:hypothetical protein